MKPVSFALTIAAVLTAVSTANAWLGDSEDALTHRYGKPKVVQLTNGDIPTQKGYYAELKETYGTNVSLIASTDKGYNMDLVENRKRYMFLKDGLGITVYVGLADEKYDGIDFAGKSAREVIACPVVPMKDKYGDKIGHPVAFLPAVINTILDDNKGDSTWPDVWHSIPLPGTYIKRTLDKSRIAIAYGVSENEIYRIDVQMVDDATKSLN